MASTRDSTSADDETVNIEEDDDIVELEEDVPAGTTKKLKRARKLSSVVWNYFELVEGKNKKKFAKCKACGKSYAGDSKYGTGNMKRHIPVCPRKDTRDVGQCLLSQIDGSVVNLRFNDDEFRELVAIVVIMHDLPFQFVEWAAIKNFLCYLRPGLNLISRNNCRADCMKIFNREKVRVKSMLESTLGRICLTSDCWSSITTDGYICLTGHFIDKDWHLQKRVLNFCYLPPPHSGVALCEKIHIFLCGWQIDTRIFSITLDNASANDVCSDLLKNLLVAKGGLLSKGDFFHMRCYAHVLNLIVQDGLKEIDESVAKIRESIKYVKGSQARRIKFLECVGLCGLDSKKGLRQDVPTRWNSTYLMLDNALYYQNAFMHLQMSDSNFKHCPSFDEWAKVEKICEFLQVFNDITCLFSGVKYLTANLFFPLVFTAHLTLIENMSSEDVYMKSMAEKMYAKFQKYWYEYARILAIAVILDPRYKLSFVEWCYKKLFGDKGVHEAAKVREDMFNLCSEYLTVGSLICHPTIGASGTKLAPMVEIDAFQSSASKDKLKEFDFFECDDVNSQKNQLELYLDEPRMDQKIKLDVLAYWKGNQYRYPQIAAMARDVLAIPVTTVASESAFSNSGRVLDQYRSALKPDVVEALVCSRDWLFGDQDANKMEMEELTKDIIELNLDSMELDNHSCPSSSNSVI